MFGGKCVKGIIAKKRQRVILIILITIILAATSCKETSSKTFPEKPVTLIVYTGPGGLIDITARKFVDIAGKYTDATFVVENKAGSGGIVALKSLLQKPADGYTFMASTKSNISKIVATKADGFIEDIEWAAMMMADPECIITNRQNEMHWEDIIQDAREKDGNQLWLGPANGGLDHVTAMKIWEQAGISAKWIPYKSGGKAKAALLGKQGIAYVGNPREVVGNDNLQIAAVSASSRLPQFPDVPTLTELGLQGLENEFMWRGFIYRKGIPQSVKLWYDELFAQVSADEEWLSYWRKGGIEAEFTPAEEFTKIVMRDKDDFTHYLSKLGIINQEENSFWSRAAQGTGLAVIMSVFTLIMLVLLILAKTQHKQNYWEDILIPAFFILLSLIFYLQTYTFPSNEEVGPAIIPRLWIMILIPLNLILIVQAVINKKIQEKSHTSKTTLNFILLLILYLPGIHFLGYFLSSFIFIICGLLLLGYRKKINILLISAGWLIFSFLVFYKLLYVPLPAGRLFAMIF